MDDRRIRGFIGAPRRSETRVEHKAAGGRDERGARGGAGHPAAADAGEDHGHEDGRAAREGQREGPGLRRPVVTTQGVVLGVLVGVA
jgi:hypothetical protein